MRGIGPAQCNADSEADGMAVFFRVGFNIDAAVAKSWNQLLFPGAQGA